MPDRLRFGHLAGYAHIRLQSVMPDAVISFVHMVECYIDLHSFTYSISDLVDYNVLSYLTYNFTWKSYDHLYAMSRNEFINFLVKSSQYRYAVHISQTTMASTPPAAAPVIAHHQRSSDDAFEAATLRLSSRLNAVRSNVKPAAIKKYFFVTQQLSIPPAASPAPSIIMQPSVQPTEPMPTPVPTTSASTSAPSKQPAEHPTIFHAASASAVVVPIVDACSPQCHVYPALGSTFISSSTKPLGFNKSLQQRQSATIAFGQAHSAFYWSVKMPCSMARAGQG